jgi:ribonuclease P protein component
VVRNAVKRRLREASRAWLDAHPDEAVDLVVVARPEAPGADFGDLRDDLLRLLATVASPPLEDRGGTPG